MFRLAFINYLETGVTFADDAKLFKELKTKS